MVSSLRLEERMAKGSRLWDGLVATCVWGVQHIVVVIVAIVAGSGADILHNSVLFEAVVSWRLSSRTL